MPDKTSSHVRVRRAERADVPAIVRLLADDRLGATREIVGAVGEPLAQVYWDAFDAMMEHPGNEYLVAEMEGEVVGCLQLTIIRGMSRAGLTRGQFEGVRVSSQHRGHGIGEQLMRAAIERARTLGCRIVQLTSDRTRVDALRFYERLGFVPSHVGMKLTLD
jgi:ribosomal protein S18 acetylase RimI-like enzyme